MLKFLLFLFLQLVAIGVTLGVFIWRIFVDFKIKGIWSCYINDVKKIYNDLYSGK